MKNKLICTTLSKPGSHKLFIEGNIVLDEPTEIDLSRKAQKMGINFKELDYKVGPVPRVGCIACTTWYGNDDQVRYLHWKGTLGAGMRLRQIAKETRGE